MVTPRSNLSRLTPGQLFREEDSGRLSQRELVAELQRRQRVQREQRQRQLAQQDRQQELADVQAQRRAILGTPRARQVAQDVLDRRRRIQPAAPIERIAPIPVIAPEPPPVRREEVRQLSSEEIAQRVERRQLGAGQAQAELQRRVREAPTAPERERAQQSLRRVPSVTRPRELPEDIQRFASAEGTNLVRARQADISEERLIREGFSESDVKGASATARAINRLRPFVDAQGNVDINEAVKKLDSETLQQAGISRTSIALASQQNLALKKLEKFTDDEGTVNLASAKRAGVSNQVIRQAGFSDQDINAAARRVIAFNRLASFAVRDPKTQEVGIDLVAAVSSRELLGGGFVSEGRKRGVNDQLLRDAGFTQPQINEAREVARQLNPLPNTRAWYTQIGKEVGVQAADALVPGLWARNWNKLSNKDRAINIAFDALYVVPLVGTAARTTGKAARAASRLSRAERGTKNVLSNVKAAQPKTAASDVEQRLRNIERLNNQDALQQLNLLVKAEQVRSKAPNFKRAVDRIDAILDESAKRKALSDLVQRSFPSAAEQLVAETNLIKSANAVKKTVTASGGTAADAKAAERATLEIGNALIQGTPKALPAPAKRLALIGRKYDIPALVERVEPLTTSGQKVSDLFKDARRFRDDLPDAPGNIKNRIQRIEDNLLSIDERLKEVPKRQIETLEQDIKVTQEKIESLRRRPSSPVRQDRIEKLQERLQETRRQVKVAERPVQPLIEVKTISQVAQPIATRQQAARVIAQQRRATRSIAKPLDVTMVNIRPTKAAKRTRVRLPVTIRPTAAMTAAELSVLAVPARRQRVSTRTAISQQPSERLRQRQQVVAMLRQQLQDQRQEIRQSQTQLKQAQKQQEKQQLQQKLAQQEKQVQQTEVKLKQQEKLATQTRVRTKTTTKAPTKVTTKKAARPKFDLPGDAEKQLKPGEFPRTVTWRQGLVNITVDIDRGTRTFSKAKGTGKGITPDESFRVLQKDKTRPTEKEFDQGVVKLNVTPRRVFFTRRRLRGS